MSFTSFAFLFFLPVVFVVYWILQSHLRLQNLWVVIASYVFYSWWDVRFLLLIIITSCSSYGSALLISRNPSRRGLILWLNILLNLGILACFKYYNFFADSLRDIGETIGVDFSIPELSIILPVGISFYTFQSLGYVLDVYRGKAKPATDIIAFLAFVSFFPQLVAGPIERATSLLPQMLSRRYFNRNDAVDGLRQTLWGVFKKMVIADSCAMAVNQVWDTWQDATGTMLLMGMLLFTFQIYCDFSGYSDIAIGVSKLFGIRLCDNFRCPYFSRNMTEFWRRWHISLMTWFRDYVYIPLGGSHGGKGRTIVNIFVVFLLSGLWHGANWTFVTWGFYHAFLLVLLLLFNRKKQRYDDPASFRQLPSVLLTLTLVAIGWVIFRSDSVNDGVAYLVRMFCLLPSVCITDLVMGKVALILCSCLMIVEWLTRYRRYALDFSPTGIFRKPVCRWLLYYVLLLMIILMHGDEQMFVYFQF
jgi:D-alanyl-lipoteichoic acid acyltransferase DltB (MBOAT superfamily)